MDARADPAPRRRPRDRSLLALVLLVGLALHLPALRLGRFADDHGIDLALAGELEGRPMRPWNVYDFGEAPRPGEPAWETGAFPWWTAPEWKLRFFRPLTSLSFVLDRALFGADLVARHAHSLAWFAVLLALLDAFYRSLGLSRGVAALATLLYAADDATLVPVAWLANRNSLLEVVFTVAAALAALRARTFARLAAATVGFSLCACLAKESGVAAPVLAALALLERSRRERAAGAAPDARIARLAALLVALAFAWLAFLVASGYGSRSAFYPTPWGAPLAWLGRLAVMASAGALSLFTPLSPDLGVVEPSWMPALCAAGLAFGAPLAFAVARRARATPGAALLAAWIPVSLLPQVGTLPSARLLFGASVGGSALLAVWLASALSRRARAPAPPRARAAAAVVALAALPVSALFVVAGGTSLAADSARLARVHDDADLAKPPGARLDAVVLQAPAGLWALSPLSVHRARGGDPGVRFFPMQAGRRGLAWSRVDERTFDLETRGEPFLELPFETVFRADERPPAAGERWRFALGEVVALRADARGLAAFRVRLDRPLDDPTIRFLAWDGARLARVAPPAVGEAVELAPVEPLSAMLR